MKWVVFLVFFIFLIKNGDLKYTFAEMLKKKIQGDLLNTINQSYSFYNKTIEGNVPQLYDSALADSPELIAHQNRVYRCSDHPQVTNTVCKRANEPCFCSEHESYTYSFCRKSCGYCSDEEIIPREYWRVRTIGTVQKPLAIMSILFYHSGLDKDVVTTEHKPNAYMDQKSLKLKKKLKIFPNGWFEYQMNRFDAKNDSFVGYKFGYPIIVNAMKIKFGKQNKHRLFIVEASSSQNGPYFKRWLFRTFEKPKDNIYYKHNCPVLWKKYETSYSTFCYRLVANFTTWKIAKHECENQDANLVSIGNKHENNFIANVIKPCNKTWIGYNSLGKGGHFSWTNKKFENWFYKHKNESLKDKSKHCVTIDQNGKWSTDSCSSYHHYICKKKINNIPEIKYDTDNINLDAPMLFFADDFSKPLLNTTETNTRKLKEDYFFDIRLSNYLPHDSPQK